MKTNRRWKSWRAIVLGFVAVTLGGFRNQAWSEDVAPPATVSGNTLEQQVNQLDQEVKTLQQQVQANQTAHNERLVPPGQAVQFNPPLARQRQAVRDLLFSRMMATSSSGYRDSSRRTDVSIQEAETAIIPTARR